MFSCKGDIGPAGADGIAGADTVTVEFQNGVFPSDAYSGCEDATIEDDYPTYNMGECDYLFTGTYTATKCRHVIKFDLSYIIPDNVQVTGAYLTYTKEDSYGTNTFTAYALTRDWTEGTGACFDSGTPDVNVSWNYYDGSGNSWTTAGGDYNLSAVSNSVFIDGSETTVTFQLNASMVQSWISDPSLNNGVIIIADNENTGTNWLRVYSSEETTGNTLRPKLTINYTAP